MRRARGSNEGSKRIREESRFGVGTGYFCVVVDQGNLKVDWGWRAVV